jgi:hypothetical protein
VVVLDRGCGPLVTSNTKENETSNPLFLVPATQLTDDSGSYTVAVFFRLIGLWSGAFNKTALCDFQSRNQKRRKKNVLIDFCTYTITSGARRLFYLLPMIDLYRKLKRLAWISDTGNVKLFKV